MNTLLNVLNIIQICIFVAIIVTNHWLAKLKKREIEEIIRYSEELEKLLEGIERIERIESKW